MFHHKDNFGMQRAPIKEGETVSVTIESVGEKGDGIARVKGFVVFVPGVKQGDKVTVRVTRVLRKFAFGEVVGEGSAPDEETPSEESEGEEESSEENSEDFEEKTEDSESFGGEEEKE